MVRTVLKRVFIMFYVVLFLATQNVNFYLFQKPLEPVRAATDPVVGFFAPSSAWTTVGDATLNLPNPDPQEGDLLLATISIRPSTSTINTPSGWTLLSNRVGSDGGSEGVDAGSVRHYVFYKVATGSEGSSTTAFTENGTTSVSLGTILRIRSATKTYDLADSGYSINSDSTNWNGTLDTDPGYTAGDLIILFASQVGDASDTSAWAFNATGITATNTIYEHGEFTSTTGNDVETGLASVLITEGTNTATPTITLTQSVAVSGAVIAIRVRQGSGTRRTDTWVRSVGAQVVGTTSLAVPYPEHSVGELLILFVATRYNVTPTTPTGWTSLGSYNGVGGTDGVDTGNARITGFYLQVTTLLTGTRSLTITSGNAAIGQMVSIRKDDVSTWSIDSDGGNDSTPNTTWSFTGSGIDLSSAYGGDIVLIGNAVNTDAYTYSSHALTASGITFGDTKRIAEYRSTTGSDNTLELVTSRVTAGTANNVATTFTSTASGSTASAPAGGGLIVKVVGIGTGTVSISVSDGTVNYGNVPLGQSRSTLVSDLNDLQTFTNDGDVTTTVNIKGQNTACPWILSTSVGSDQYVHEFYLNPASTWWNDAWTKRIKITFNNSGQSENLTNFPVLVKLNSSRISYNNIQNSGQDIRFVDADGTLLNHEIERWDESGDSFVWVNVPQIDSNSSNDYIYMYYGNASASDGQDIGNTWNSNFAGIWHLDEDPSGSAPQFYDSKNNVSNGTANGSMVSGDSIPGKVGNAINTDGTNDFINIPNFAGINLKTNMTVSFWFKPDNTINSGISSNLGLISKSYSNTDAENDWTFFWNSTESGSLRFGTYGDFVRTNTSTWTAGTWYYITVVVSGTNTAYIYVNGTQDNAASDTSISANPINGTQTTDIKLGLSKIASGDRFFDGQIDSFKISNNSRSADWVKASYLTESDSFNTYDVEESVPSITWTKLTTSYQTLVTGLTPLASRGLHLKVTVPTSNSCSATQYVDVTLQAVQE